MEYSTIQDIFTSLEMSGVIKRQGENVIFIDLKQKEIEKIYRMKSSSTPEEVAASCENNKKRNSIIKAINNTFFQGVMSPSWYTDIDAWFDRYNFDEDVMYALFNHCYEHNALAKNYISKVAESWYVKKVKSGFDLDRYSIEQQKFNKIRSNIVKKLKLNRNLTVYEEEFMLKWIDNFGYDFEIIDIALRKTAGKTSPNFKYVDAIISEWNKNNLKTKNEIFEYEKERKSKMASGRKGSNDVPMYRDFEQRKYDSEYEDGFFDNKK